MSGTEREIAHFALDPAEVAVVAAGDDALLEYLVKDRFMESPLLQRGE